MRFINPGSFALALLCFLLPFVDIKCNDAKLVSYKGTQLVIGVKPSEGLKGGMMGGMADMMDKYKNKDETTENTEVKEETQRHIPLIAIAIILIIAGVTIATLTFTNKPLRSISIWSIVSYSLVLLGLVAEFIFMEVGMKAMNDKMSGESAGMMGSLKFSWGMGTGFWLLLLISVGLIIYNIIALRKPKQLLVVENPAAPENPWPSQPGEGQI